MKHTAADVEPVFVVGRKLPGDGGLHEINKLGKGNLALLLEVDSITLHELVSVDILDGDAGLLQARLLSETRHFLQKQTGIHTKFSTCATLILAPNPFQAMCDDERPSSCDQQLQRPPARE